MGLLETSLMSCLVVYFKVLQADLGWKYLVLVYSYLYSYNSLMSCLVVYLKVLQDLWVMYSYSYSMYSDFTSTLRVHPSTFSMYALKI